MFLGPDYWSQTAARILADGPVPVSKACKFVPTLDGKEASPSTLVRWIVHGKRGVRLDGARMTGKTWHTSRQALERFWGALSAAEAGKRERGGLTLIQREKEAQADCARLLAMVGE